MFLALAAGFSTSTVEIAIFFAILLSAFGAWIAYSISSNRAASRRLDEEAETHFRELVESRNLGPIARDLLERLSRYQRNPREKYQLVQDQRVFNRAAAIYLETDPDASDAQVSALRRVLGFLGNPTGDAPHATGELPPGEDVLVMRPGRTPVAATIRPQTTTALELEIDSDGHRLAAGNPVKVIYRNEAGIFRFDSTVLRCRERIVQLNHSEHVTRTQRRKFYRRTVRLAAQIKPLYGPDAGPESGTRSSTFVELGGNGGTLVNPDPPFRAADDIEILFHPASGARLVLPATVERTSQDDTRLHVRFTTIRERERDVIYRLLFSRRSEE